MENKCCGDCKKGELRSELDRVECFLYDDLMFQADVCPLWSD